MAWRVNSTSSGLSSTSRISMDFSCIGSCSFESEVECRTLVDGRFRPDAPTVAVDDALDDRQTDAGSLIVLWAMQARGHPEKSDVVLHVDPHPIVFHEVHARAGLLS